MLPRLVSLLRPPDVVSLANAGLGFGALTALIAGSPELAARLLLIAGVADGLDGFIAQHTSTSGIGVELDSLADAVSFGVVPAVLVYLLSRDSYTFVSLVSVVFIVAVLIRLAAYNVQDADRAGFTGVPSTLAGTSIAAIYLADLSLPVFLYLGFALVFSYLMLIQTHYPDLRKRDALVMGGVMGLAGIFPNLFYSVLPRVLVFFLFLFLVLSPILYSGADEPRQ